MDKAIIEVTIDNGDLKVGQVLFSFEASGDNFIMYAIEDVVYGAKMQEDGSLAQVYDDEWKLLEKMFNEYMEEHHEHH